MWAHEVRREGTVGVRRRPKKKRWSTRLAFRSARARGRANNAGEIHPRNCYYYLKAAETEIEQREFAS